MPVIKHMRVPEEEPPEETEIDEAYHERESGQWMPDHTTCPECGAVVTTSAWYPFCRLECRYDTYHHWDKEGGRRAFRIANRRADV